MTPDTERKTMRYVKKPIVVEATQWFKNGDHPEDRVGKQELDVQALADLHPELFQEGDEAGPIPEDAPTYTRQEGAVVRYYRDPNMDGQKVHNELPWMMRPNCTAILHDHGWIDTMEGGHTVCPGDWVITGVRGEVYPCEDSIFRETYEEAT